MGQATVTKKRVLGKVEDCVAAVNEVIAACTEMAEKHDALCGDLNVKHAEIESRFTAQGNWLETHTDQLAAVAGNLATLQAGAADARRAHEALDSSAARAFKLLADRLTDLERVLGDARTEAETFASLGFFGRLRWLFSWRREALTPTHSVETHAGAFHA